MWIIGKRKQSNLIYVSLFEKKIFLFCCVRWQRRSVWYIAQNWTVDASLLCAWSWRRQYSLGGGPGGAISALSGRTDAPTEHRVTFISSQMLALLVKQIKTTSGASVLSFVSISGLKTNGINSSGHMSLAAGM